MLYVDLAKHKFMLDELVLLTELVLEDHFCNGNYFLSQVQFTVQVEPNL